MSIAFARRGTMAAARRHAISGSKVAVPGAGRTYFGAVVESSTLSSELAIESRETYTGRTYDLHLSYYAWTDALNFATGSQAALDVIHGRIPQISWGYGSLDLSGILAGTYDTFITQQATAARQFGHPFFLRLGIEMNGGSESPYTQQPVSYIAAWKHVKAIFDSQGASNVSWVWCPNIDSKGGVYTWDDYYPGDTYVDWIGVDGYNTSTYGDPDRSFGTIFTPFLSHFAGRKPLMIGEFATDSSFGNAAAWITAMGQWVTTNADTYGLRAICWFDTNLSSTGIDYRVDQTGPAYTAWKNAVNLTIFGGVG